MEQSQEKINIDLRKIENSGGSTGISELKLEEEEISSVIKKRQWTIIELRSHNSRLVNITGTGVINLGKFGKFKESEIIGKPMNLTYEVLPSGALKPVLKKRAINIEDSKYEGTVVLSESSNSQNLSYEQISDLKNQFLQGDIHGDHLIETLIRNSTTFSQKSMFAKQKYIAKKIDKYRMYFTVKAVTSRALCTHFFNRDKDRIKGLTPNALFQILNQAHVHSGGKYLIVDETNGILVAAIYERIRGDGLVFVVSEKDNYQPHVICYFNEKMDKIRRCVKYIPWFRIDSEHDNDLIEEVESDYIDKSKKYIEIFSENRSIFESEEFDSLIVISKRDPVKVVELLSSKVTGSGQIVFYSPYKETLIGLYTHMKASSSYVNVRMFEVSTRQYQVPSDAGGMHSIMKSPGVDNYILTAIKVFQ